MADIKHYIQVKKDIEEKNARKNDPKATTNVVKLETGKYNNSSDSNEVKSNRTTDEFEQKIRIHRIKLAVIIAGSVAMMIIMALIILTSLESREYSDYVITKSINKDASETAQYIDFNNGYIRYSVDGITYYTNKGIALWNQTYQMKNPQVKLCGNSVAVGDINGQAIYIFNDKGMIGSVDTSLSISQIEVASQGVVAAVLEDANANYIKLYSIDGEEIYTVKTTLSSDGYPLDISISEDATKLVASYVHVKGDSIKTNVVFYSFSGVGQNKTDRIVGGFDHGSVIIPEVQFANETCAVAIGENSMSIYKIKEYPKYLKEIAISSEINRVFLSDQYIGLVLKNTESSDLYKLVVYSLNGSQLFEKTFNTEYKTIKFDGKSIIMYNDTNFTLMNIKGKIQLDQTFDLPIDSILSLGTKGKYLVISSKYIQEIKLK